PRGRPRASRFLTTVGSVPIWPWVRAGAPRGGPGSARCYCTPGAGSTAAETLHARMRGMMRTGGWSSHPLVLGGLVLVFGLQVLSEGLSKSPTFDEPAHIGAGFSYLKTGEFKVNLQHPPLLKEIGALPLLAMGAKFPVSPENWSEVDQTTDPFFQWQLGNQVLVDNGEQRVLSWSRAPFVLLALVLAGLIVAWGKRMLGGASAAGALLLFVFDPTIVAHAPLVATDSGMAL